MLRRTLVMTATIAAVTSGCLIGTDDFEGKGCQSAADCPKDFYNCVPVLDGGKVCEVIFPKRALADAGRDAGPADSGTLTPFYCTSVKAMLARTCLSNCHVPDYAGSFDSTFRLDIYENDGGSSFLQTLPDGGVGPPVLGAKNKATNILARITNPQPLAAMPPPFPAGLPKPTDAERAMVGAWVDAGAPFCDPSVAP